MMTINTGDAIPDIEFQFREGDIRPEQGTCPMGGKFVTKSSKDLFANKRVIIFSLPGAFTPTCSTYQLPGFDQNFETFRQALLWKFESRMCSKPTRRYHLKCKL